MTFGNNPSIIGDKLIEVNTPKRNDEKNKLDENSNGGDILSVEEVDENTSDEEKAFDSLKKMFKGFMKPRKVNKPTDNKEKVNYSFIYF